MYLGSKSFAVSFAIVNLAETGKTVMFMETKDWPVPRDRGL